MTAYQYDAQHPQIKVLPTMYDLPSEDPEEPGLDVFHRVQAQLTSDSCIPPNHPLDRLLIASDLNIYYDPNHPNWYKKPDWFIVVGVPQLYRERDLRMSYVVWDEQVIPLIVAEFLSDSTEAEDLGFTYSEPNKPPTKWQVYERILKIPYYIIFSKNTNQLRIFKLVRNRYREQVLTNGKFWIPELELSIGLWFGTYHNCARLWLRWYDINGNLVLTPEEFERQRAQLESQRAELESQRAEAERERAESESQRAEVEKERAESERERAESESRRAEAERERANRLAEILRAMNINPDEL
ncbi:MAG: Uma2 family endonuclease [Richelia sp. CSU_2_1]|nr:Uma2 family endonuclease [Richelia sp. CSU_2_1]